MSVVSRRFFLRRTEDVSGVSGTGVVAEGVRFGDGAVALHWHGTHPSTIVYASVEAVEAIHGHNGATQLVWRDPICFACGCVLTDAEREEHHCFSCGAGQGMELCYESKADPSRGAWSPAIKIDARAGGTTP